MRRITRYVAMNKRRSLKAKMGSLSIKNKKASATFQNRKGSWLFTVHFPPPLASQNTVSLVNDRGRLLLTSQPVLVVKSWVACQEARNRCLGRLLQADFTPGRN